MIFNAVKKYQKFGITYNTSEKTLFFKFCNVNVQFWQDDSVRCHLNTSQHLNNVNVGMYILFYYIFILETRLLIIIIGLY
jgi:hypothetical protein